ncbi:MAG: response regulator transcription factor [Anaerolineae bacterium]
MRVLVIEDEKSIAQNILKGLSEAGYAVDVVGDGKNGLDYALAARYDAILLDILLPGMDGLHLLRELRYRGIQTPVLLLTALGAVEQRVQGLDAGADDYLVKPFAFSELLARLRALQRRPPLQTDNILEVGDLRMDVARRQVVRAERTIDLTVREFSILEYLMRHPNQVLSRTQIAEHVWNFDFYNESNVVDVYIGYLRRKLDRGYESQLIHTVRGIGYQFGEERKDV